PKEDTRDAVIDACQALATRLRERTYGGEPLRVHVDDRDLGGGVKKWEWVKKGVPLRVEIGPRDLEERKVCLQRRDQAANEKSFIEKEEFLREVVETLDNVHQSLLQRALDFREENITECSDLETFEKFWVQENPGWLVTPWAGSREQEEELSKKHKITIRCLPLDKQAGPEADCILTGSATPSRAIWGRSY
ncbi:MAG TPA: proline--tRNA ligase, partial [Verrucomicrobiales bacterium]|nr:proline--tRNA ligase [Verrucomicrobiales bacterium]